MSLPETIKALRLKSLLSQDAFAKELHVSVLTINRWENGKTKPNITAMKNLRTFCSENDYPFTDIESEWRKESHSIAAK